MAKTKRKGTIQERETKRRLKNKTKRTKRRLSTIRKTLKTHLGRIKDLGPGYTGRIRIMRFLNYLKDLGKEKGKIDNDFFIRDQLKIAEFIIKKYGKQCDEETGPIMIDTRDIEENGEKIVVIQELGKLFVCLNKLLQLKKDNKPTKPLILTFSSSNRYKRTEAGHRNLLVINIDKREIVRIDPMGNSNTDDMFYLEPTGRSLANELNTRLGITIESDKYKYINNDQTTCPINPQQKLTQLRSLFFINRKKRPSKIETGTCVLWSMLFSEIILGYPELEYEEVLGYLSSYIHNDPDSTLYIIRGYFWYLTRELLLADNKKEEKDDSESEEKEEDQFEQLTISLSEYVSKLEKDQKYYSPLHFAQMYDKLNEVIMKIKRIIPLIDSTIQKEAVSTLSIYNPLAERYRSIKKIIDSKRSQEENDMENELLFIIMHRDNTEEIEKRYGPGPELLQRFRHLLSKIKLETRDKSKGIGYQIFYSQAENAINHIVLEYINKTMNMEQEDSDD